MQTETIECAGREETRQSPAAGSGVVCEPDPPADISTLVPSFLHDANGALFVVLQFAELLVSGSEQSLTESQQRMLQVVHDRACATYDVLESLRAAVNLEHGRFACRADACSMSDVMELAMPRMLRRSQPKRGSIKTRVSESLPPVWCDPNGLSLTLTNLYCHVASRLHESFSVTVAMERSGEGRRVVCRFLLNDAELPDDSAQASTYLRVATSLAEACHAVVHGADPRRGQLAALSVPVAEHLAVRSAAGGS